MKLVSTVMVAAVAALACSVAVPREAHAFCGFYVAPGDQKLVNDATQVVLMRSGTRTVLSMQNNYQGPPADFAMVVPVPVVLHEGDVKTLPKAVFEHVEAMGAPRLVEYWEQDPCRPPPDMELSRAGAALPTAAAMGGVQGGGHGVKIEAQFQVGEYDVVILSAQDSTGLDTWLREQKYKIPAGAEPLLRPYVESGMKFFVAKVDPKKVTFVGGRAALSPLRFHYDSEDFALPIRLGLANSSGTQDLIVSIFSPDQRYEVANYHNVTIPTNLDVSEQMKSQFGAFYAALFDRTVQKHPGAVVTEYAWAATSCDPCPGPTLDPSELATLGADVLTGTARPDTYSYGNNFVLTRLHARYGTDINADLQFKAASPITGGREQRGESGKLEEGATPASSNNFQGRYAIRHPWVGPITCDKPQRGNWGGPTDGSAQVAVKPALGLAFAPRGSIVLASAVLQDVPEIDLHRGASDSGSGMVVASQDFGGSGAVPAAAGSAAASGSASATSPLARTRSGGCCDAGDAGGGPGDLAGAVLIVGLALAKRRQR